MEKVIYYIFLIIVILCGTNTNSLSQSNSNQNHESKIIGIITIINHGASTPTSYYDNMKEIFSPHPNGVLTATGAKQMKILGHYFKKKYFSHKSSLLDKEKNSNYLAMSIGLPRCINSAISNLQSIFPKDLVAFRNYQSNEDNNTTISRSTLGNYFDYNDYVNKTDENKIKDTMINFMDNTQDKLLSPRKCFRLNKTYISDKNNYTHQLNESEIDIVIKNLNSTFPKLIAELSLSKFSLNKIANIYDHLNSIGYDGTEQPQSQTNLTRVLAKYKMKHQYQYLNDDDEVKLLSSNLFDMFLVTFDKIINVEKGNLRKIGNKNNFNSMFIYAEENNMIDIFNNLIDADYLRNLLDSDSVDINYHDELLPPFASHVVFELSKLDEVFYVKIIYNGEEIFTNPKKLKRLTDKIIPYHPKNGMRYEDFKSLLLSRINEKYKSIDCK